MTTVTVTANVPEDKVVKVSFNKENQPEIVQYLEDGQTSDFDLAPPELAGYTITVKEVLK